MHKGKKGKGLRARKRGQGKAAQSKIPFPKRHGQWPILLFSMDMLFAAAFALYVFFKILKVSNAPQFGVAFSAEGFDYFVAGTFAVLSILLYAFLKRNYAKYAAWNRQMTAFFAIVLRQKVHLARTDVRHTALAIAEIALIAALAFGLWAVLDGKVDFINKELPAWMRVAVFALIAGIGLSFYNYSKDFRLQRKEVAVVERRALLKKALQH